MFDNRGVLYCDCCGRQIVDRLCSDDEIVGPTIQTKIIGVNKHVCVDCAEEEKWSVYMSIMKDYGEEEAQRALDNHLI